ncbi:hypothetical protein LAC81_01900 [Ensifer adhaerens]|uniref:hypothetical protein n=1 Tax=Ensifer adhaerens TaxID=106592 RepID=UPI001CBFD282|nr:hypothetical protein [Ensifer adhaerens]MBZ7920539.1 hypothetical protein [Ensifer adhaerens]UAX93017.1 hypothetical protein LAC78_01900 [Ensifer adhaerens]UAY00652.1 hypothetical protein LAC80_01900 [Ensifer adhaerens]UAY08033.1 hypothetical protein LAC81_01900 [Ensifer adhaerens]
MNLFEHHLTNIPIVVGERDTDRYLRAFAATIDRLDADADGVCDVDAALAAARGAIRFIADDAFRRGFETCHENVVEPLRCGTISREDALKAMAKFGERVRQTIVSTFEEEKDVPNQLTADIDSIELPRPVLRSQQ